MSIIALLGLLIDFGLVVLIWMTQLIVYPSFRYYTIENLVRWHRKYTAAVAVVVAPLLLLQLGISIYQVVVSPNIFILIHLGIVVTLWLLTFWQFMPIHRNITRARVSNRMLQTLVNKNWLRTLLWSAVFVLALLNQLL